MGADGLPKITVYNEALRQALAVHSIQYAAFELVN